MTQRTTQATHTTHLDDATPVQTVERESGIEWCTHTIEVTDGCTHKSAGCDNCYAARFVEVRLSKAHPKRFGGLTTKTKDGTPIFNGVVRERPQGLVEILKAKPGARVFINSRSDLFHRDVSDEYIAAVFGAMAARPDVTFQILTKRPDRMDQWFNDFIPRTHLSILGHTNSYLCEHLAWTLSRIYAAQRAWPLPNVWLGVSAENQATLDERVPHLLRCPAAVRWLSIEPLLGPISLRWRGIDNHPAIDPDTRRVTLSLHNLDGIRHNIHWVVVGGESGPNARPMHPDWVRSIRDQCHEAGVPFFFKQWGGTNKKATGRLLDGKLHDEYPASDEVTE